MKKILILLLFTSNTIYAQVKELYNTYPLKDGRIVFENVKDLPGINKTNIYAASKKWISDTFKDGKSVIQSDDFETGQILVSGYTNVIIHNTKGKVSNVVNYKFSTQIDAKDQKYRIRIYDLQIYKPSYGRFSDESLTPLEFIYTDKRLVESQGKFEQAKAAAISIQNHFSSLMNSLSNSIEKSSSDTF